jgi:hypothetical protein
MKNDLDPRATRWIIFGENNAVLQMITVRVLFLIILLIIILQTNVPDSGPMAAILLKSGLSRRAFGRM